MADPFSWMMVAAAVQTVGTLQQANAQSEAAKYNAKLAEQAARTEWQQTGAREEALRRKQGQFLGAQRAAVAESGGGFGGSARDIMEESAALAELDAMTMRYEGTLRAQGFQAQAQAYKDEARQARINGIFGATGSILSSVGDYQVGQARQRAWDDMLGTRKKPLPKWGAGEGIAGTTPDY